MKVSPGWIAVGLLAGMNLALAAGTWWRVREVRDSARSAAAAAEAPRPRTPDAARRAALQKELDDLFARLGRAEIRLKEHELHAARAEAAARAPDEARDDLRKLVREVLEQKWSRFRAAFDIAPYVDEMHTHEFREWCRGRQGWLRGLGLDDARIEDLYKAVRAGTEKKQAALIDFLNTWKATGAWATEEFAARTRAIELERAAAFEHILPKDVADKLSAESGGGDKARSVAAWEAKLLSLPAGSGVRLAYALRGTFAHEFFQLEKRIGEFTVRVKGEPVGREDEIPVVIPTFEVTLP